MEGQGKADKHTDKRASVGHPGRRGVLGQHAGIALRDLAWRQVRVGPPLVQSCRQGSQRRIVFTIDGHYDSMGTLVVLVGMIPRVCPASRISLTSLRV